MRRAWLGWALLVVTGLLLVAPIVHGFEQPAFLPIAIASLLMGWLITARVPGNPIGPLLLVAGLVWPLQEAAIALTNHVLEPVGAVFWTAAYVSEASGFVFVTLAFAAVPQLFPNGLALPRWRWLLWITYGYAIGMIVAVVGAERLCVERLTGECTALVANPIGVWQIDLYGQTPGDPLGWLGVAWVPLALFGILTAVIRFRRSHGIERQQLRWFAAGVSGAIVLLAGGYVIGEVVFRGRTDGSVSGIAFYLAAVLVPVSVGVAVLKFHLYDLGRVVSRTATYAVLVALVVGAYAVGAVWLPTRLGIENPTFVAATTLGIAVAFNPVRRWLTTRLERRFNRMPYDPQAVSDGLTVALRDRTDTGAISAAWAGVVNEALQPASISVWTTE